MITLLPVLAAATVLEKLFGSETVHEYIYGAWWFVLLWAVLGVSALGYIFTAFSGALTHLKTHGLSVRPIWYGVFFHCSLSVILLGALVTYLSADRGYVHIRQTETVHSYLSDEETEQPLPFGVKLLLFDIEYHPDTDIPADYISFLQVDGETVMVSMNKIFKRQAYRFYQMDYDADEMGVVLLVSRDPWGIGITYAGYLLLAVSMALLLWLRIGWKGILCLLIPVTGAGWYISSINPMTPVLRSPMLALHVSVIAVSYLLLLAITILSVVAISYTKHREQLYRLNIRLLYPALFLLAAGIFIGAMWANISWGRYWGWDAKETWALITLLVYALPLHRKSLTFFKNTGNFHRYCIIAFLSILITFFGVSFFIGGIHSYM
ncbi:MAG: cytochrome c biogenesis protein CcsA [Bacteroidales bacterium]|nr:cytochrome c biogenesis protein CcsA [Bacteroidales bacterium]